MARTIIPASDCKHGYLYLLHARNAEVGVYCEPRRAFIYLRTKFSFRFLDEEYHYEMGAEGLGTARPIRELEQAPDLDWTKTTDVLEADGQQAEAYLRECESRFHKAIGSRYDQ